MNELLAGLAGLAAWQVLAVVAGVGLVEGTGVLGYVVPGLATLVAAGSLASAGVVPLPWLLAVAITSAVVGDSTGYWLGRLVGPRLERSGPGRLLGEKRWSDGRRFLVRRGFWAVVAGRWFGPVRAIVPLLAGASGMTYGSFVKANLLGIVSYSTTAVLAGFGMASLLDGFATAFSAALPVAVAALLVAVLLVVIAQRRQPAGV